MARRSRKGRPAAPPPAEANGGPGDDPERLRRGYARSEERNAALRAGLTPLAPGERPLALTVAAALAAALAVVNLAALVLGVEVDGRRPSVLAVVLFGGLMLAAAWGLCAAILLGGGWLFWKLIRVMGRLQAPQRVS